MICLIVVAVGIMFTACNKNKKCKHDDPSQIVIVEAVPPTCLNTGLTEGMKCNLCGVMVVPQAIVNPLGHNVVIDSAVASTCTKTGLTEGRHCSVCNEVFVAQHEISIVDHIETDWIIDGEATNIRDGVKHTECTMCGKRIRDEIIPATGSLGLEYTLNADGESYSVSGIGTCKDTEILILSTYNGLPVTHISKYAFFGCNELTRIESSVSLTSIGSYAFYNCSSLLTFYFPGVTAIGNHAFYNCSSLFAISIPDSVTIIGDYAFYNCDDLVSITYYGDVEQWNSIEKGYRWDYGTMLWFNIRCNDGEILQDGTITYY